MSNEANHANSERLAMSVAEVARALNISSRHVWKLRAAGRFPEPIRLGRAVRWRAEDVELYVRVGCDMGRFHAERGARR